MTKQMEYYIVVIKLSDHFDLLLYNKNDNKLKIA